MRNWLLPASVIINAFLIGAVVAHLYAEPRRPPPIEAMERLTDDLPPADRELLRAAFVSTLDQIDQSRHDLDEISEQLRAILVKEPFDKAAFRALLQRSYDLHERLPHALTTILPDVVEKMTPEGRHKMVQWHFLGPPPPSPPRWP